MARIATIAAVVALLAAGLVAAAAPVAAASASTDQAVCDHPSAPPDNGQRAVDRLGPTGLAQAGYRTNRSADHLKAQLLSDPSLWVDGCGMTFYADPAPADPAGGPAPSASAPFPYSQTFSLHSKPGSNRTIYLDFTGYTIPTDNVWVVAAHRSQGWTASPFDTDGAPSSFSTSEQDQIQEAWQLVAEDYAPFDVDVTTADPGAAAIDRTSLSDQVYGTRAVVTEDTVVGTPCGCGGEAYVNVFNLAGGLHGYYQPALVFAQNLSQSGRAIGEAAAHEVGHNFGLSHDGTVTQGAGSYYAGQGAWAPIMGVGYYRPVTQWSKGEYTGANNQEDDLAIIATGTPVRADDHGDTLLTSTILPPVSPATDAGVISTAADQDLFHFQASGPTTIHVGSAAVGPDLDVRADLLDSSGNPIATADPPVAVVDDATASGLDATLTETLPTGTYYVRVDGVGSDDPLVAGYSDYASLGAYSLTVTTTIVAAAPAAAPASPTVVAGDAQAAVSWVAPADGGAPIDHYVVTPYVGSAAQTPLVTTDPSPTATVTGLTDQTAYTFTVAAHTSAGVGSESPPSVVVTPHGPLFHAVTPTRIVDSRPGPTHVGPLTTWGPAATQTVNVVGSAAGVPSGATAVVLNVTATGATVNGDYLTIWPAGAARPTVSSLNVDAGKTVADQVTVKLGEGGSAGKVAVFNAAGSANVLVDVSGYFDRTDDGDGFTAITPARAIDSRPGTAHVGGLGPWSGGTIQTFSLPTSAAAIPDDAVAVALNVTATGGSAAGNYLTVWPAGTTRPTASSINVDAGRTVANAVIVGLGVGPSAGQLSIFNAAGFQQVIVDVVGYYRAGSGASFYALTPSRLIDSRAGASHLGPLSSWTAGATQEVAATGGSTGVPAGAMSVVVTLTAISGTVNGDYLTVWPSGSVRPVASSLNVDAGAVVANSVTTKLGSGSGAGRFLVFNAGGVIDAAIDVAGYYA